MNISILKEIGKPNKQKVSKIYILVVLGKERIRINTGLSHNGSNEAEKDLLFNVKKNEVERKVLEAQKKDIPITKELLESDEPVKRKEAVLLEYIDDTRERLKGRVSDGRLRHYVVMYNLIERFKPKALVKDVNKRFMEEFEVFMKKQVGINTVVSRIALFKAIIHRAIDDKLLPIDAIQGYKSPSKKTTIPLYLNYQEVESIEKYLFELSNTVKKRIGMYFILSCYTGYRISDLYAFDYSEKVRDNRITIRATKNGTIVSMPVHDKLKFVLEYIKENPINLPETKFRLYLKQIAKDKGLSEKLHPHAGRHTFAMFLMAKGFTVDEVAEYLGDTVEVARTYARISHKTLDDKVLKAFNG